LIKILSSFEKPFYENADEVYQLLYTFSVD